MRFKENKLNKVVLITGCSSGIGLKLASKFIENGYVTYGMARRDVTLPNLRYVKGDVTKFEDCKDVLKKIIEEQGHIDILINNAGMGISGPIEYAGEEEAKRIMDVNFYGAWHIIKATLPNMREKNSGTIVNISSFASFTPIPFQAFYSASKSALDSLSGALRSEVKGFNIKVATIHPGDVKTGFTGAREKNTLADADPYARICNNAVSQMEKDEQGGMDADYVAGVIYKIAVSKNPRLKTIVGNKYKFFNFALNLLPLRLREWAVRAMYFGKKEKEEIEMIEPDKNLKDE